MNGTDLFRCPKCDLRGALLIGRETRLVESEKGEGTVRLVCVCTFRCDCGHQFRRELSIGKPSRVVTVEWSPDGLPLGNDEMSQEAAIAAVR